MSKHQKPNTSNRKKTSAQWPWIALLVGVAALGTVVMWPSGSEISENVDVVVYKTSTCSCCGNWVEHLRANDLEVAVINVRNTQSTQSRMGVPRELGSCHTAKVGEYWVEGHVPADLIQRLMTEKPRDILGIAVPGMPIGSPGMEGPNPVEYEVFAYDNAGQTRVHATRHGQSEPSK